MEPDQAVAAKRRALVDALMLCLQKSRVVERLDASTVRSVLASASRELWRENAFWLEPVWQLLTTQPGVSAAEVAPPMFAYKAFESELGVAVRLPHALTALPRAEQNRLRQGVAVTPDEIKGVLRAAEDRAAGEQDKGATARLIEAASASDARSPSSSSVASSSRRLPPGLAVGLAVAAAAALAGSAWWVLRDPANTFPLADTGAVLQLEGGRAVGASVTATIADPKWDAATAEERRRIAGQVFDLEAPKGIHVLSLLDRAGQTRAVISDGPGGRVIILP